MLTRLLRLGLGALLTFTTLAGAQSWTRLPNAPGSGVNTSLLLTDGTVMAHTANTGTWWRLTPDINGSYINGTWSQLASMPAGYGPLYYASAVLPDGRVVVEGGEYNLGSLVRTMLGAIYNPAKNSWTPIAPPPGWSTIGDAQSVVLHDGTLMLANCCTAQAALLNASNLTWTLTGAGKADGNNEEGWTLLPGGKVLTVDTNNPLNRTNSEVFDPGTGTWSSGGSTIVQLPDINPDNSGSHEIGPAVLRPDGIVFATGGTSNTAIYNSAFGGWSVGPTFPSGLTVGDGPAALLPSGNVLVDAGPPGFGVGAQFFEFNGTNLLAAPSTPRASGEPSFVARMLVLPTGQILLTDGSTDVEIYTPVGTFLSAWQPVISSVPSAVTRNSTSNFIGGTQFNGLSQGAAYGDDAQSATNYPLVRITNNATGHVFYAKTHDHTLMSVATGGEFVSTSFDVSSVTELGASTVQVVANGIPSNPAAILVVSCTRDSLGYCVTSQTGLLNGGRCLIAPRVIVNEHLGTVIYHILTPNGTIQDFTETVTDDGTGSCTTNESWSPGEPSVVFHDPNLP